jgi:uncharacterized Zn-finger protein
MNSYDSIVGVICRECDAPIACHWQSRGEPFEAPRFIRGQEPEVECGQCGARFRYRSADYRTLPWRDEAN